MERNNGFRKSSKAISINYWARNIYSFFLNLHHPKWQPLVTCGHLNVNLNKLKFNEIKMPVPWFHWPHLKYSAATAKILDDTNYSHHQCSIGQSIILDPLLWRRGQVLLFYHFTFQQMPSLFLRRSHTFRPHHLLLFKQDSHSLSESSGLQMLQWEAIIGAPHEWIVWKLWYPESP